MPLLSGDWCTGVTLEGPTPDAARGACPPVAIVSPGYFEAMGVRVEGRTLDWAGMNAHDGGMIVSRAFADHHWPNENPIGKGVRYNGTTPPFYRVVGVAEDVRESGLDAPPTEVVYFPARPLPDAPLWSPPYLVNVVLRTTGSDPLALTNTVTQMVQELEPGAAVANAASMETVLARSIARRSFTMVLLAIAAGIALLLSAVGIYGVISYIVTQRRGEIGVRVALGAQVGHVTRMVLGESLWLALAGVVIGVGAALATTRVLSALLYGVEPNDPATLVIVPAVLLVVALIASYAPARRAARTDPVEALRGD
jgi:predicted permease